MFWLPSQLVFKNQLLVTDKPDRKTFLILHFPGCKVTSPTSEAAGSNLGPGASCWKVGSYLPMPGGLQCRILTN